MEVSNILLMSVRHDYLRRALESLGAIQQNLLEIVQIRLQLLRDDGGSILSLLRHHEKLLQELSGRSWRLSSGAHLYLSSSILLSHGGSLHASPLMTMIPELRLREMRLLFGELSV